MTAESEGENASAAVADLSEAKALRRESRSIYKRVEIGKLKENADQNQLSNRSLKRK